MMASGGSDWDADLYEDRHGFVHREAADLLTVLDPDPGDRILDLGCGTGHLTAEIRDTGADVVGLDRSSEMLAEAQRAYPHLALVRGDARSLPAASVFDAVFSNAALHWIPDAHRAAASIGQALRLGGRFVAELGGTGNVETIVEAVTDAVAASGHDPAGRNPFYFPSVGEYATVLEAAGFEVREAWLFDRPTPLEGGKDGLRNWLSMFAERFMAGLSTEEREAVVTDIEDRLRPVLWDGGTWLADYRRLRVVAVRADEDPTASPPRD